MGRWPAGGRAAAAGHREVRRVHGRARAAAADAGRGPSRSAAATRPATAIAATAAAVTKAAEATEAATRPSQSDPVRPRPGALIHEHHRLAAVRDHTIFQMITDRAREHAPLDVAALADEVVGRVAMADALDVLVDDRPLVEIARDVMCGGADQLHPALMRLVIGFCALESRQERVMDVDAASRQLRRKIIREDLHVARQHHEIAFGLSDQVPDPAFLLAPGLSRDWQMMKRNLPEIE